MRAANFQSAIGRRFGLLVVVDEGYGKGRRVTCKCDCGNVKDVLFSTLKQGGTLSCGCHRKKRMTTHGNGNKKEYVAWVDMLRRCNNPKCKAFEHYGARGIKVCDRWASSFEAFEEDMGPRPDGGELDRIDNNGDYEPSNCRWATRTQQLRNQRRNHFVTIDGQTKTLTEWCEVYSISAPHVFGRVRYGWDVKKALTTPIRTKVKA